MSLRRSRSILAILAAMLVAACSPAATAVPSSAAAGSPSSDASASVLPSAIPTGPPAVTTKLTVGLGYIPSVQFAQFYRADQAGYYAAEGLEITFQNEIDANLVPKLGAGAVDLGLSDGTSVIPAVSQGIPIKYLATIYGQFPSIVFAKASSGITDADGLVGKKLGIPGKYGSSWIMLQALMASKGHTVADLTVVEYPDFGQGAAVTPGRGGCRDRVREQRAGPARADRREGERPAHRRRHAAAGSGDRGRDRDDRRQA